jgi:segregation and condensation protein B
MNTREQLNEILEAVLFSAGKPLTEQQLLNIFHEEERPSLSEIRQALFKLQEDYQNRGVELVCLASGYQFQSRVAYGAWISRLWEEKPAKYSRAFLETLALIAYRQPITRGEIEEIRGVSISPSIFKTLLEERGWIRVVGHRDVPGRPGLYATTKQFLDYFGLKTLDQLPALPEILALKDPSEIAALEATQTTEQQQMELPNLATETINAEAEFADEEQDDSEYFDDDADFDADEDYDTEQENDSEDEFEEEFEDDDIVDSDELVVTEENIEEY